mgnify:CR=1 FL=1
MSRISKCELAINKRESNLAKTIILFFGVGRPVIAVRQISRKSRDPLVFTVRRFAWDNFKGGKGELRNRVEKIGDALWFSIKKLLILIPNS